MAPNTSRTSEAQHTLQNPEAPLSPTIRTFLALSERYDDLCRQRGKEVRVERLQAQKALELFLTQLDKGRQREIQSFLVQLSAGRRILWMRGKIHGAVRTLAHLPVGAMHLAADTVPELSEQTVRLALRTLGLTLRGAGIVGNELIVQPVIRSLRNLLFGSRKAA